MKFKAATSAVITIVLAILMASTVHAATSFAFGTAHKRIAAGVLVAWVDPVTGTTAATSSQATFYVMNQRLDLKPAGWDFYNPMAASSTGADQPAYWNVDLRKVSFSDLQKYNVLILPLTSTPVFSSSQRQMLRRFVDGGGTLWIDNQGGHPGTTFIFDDLNFTTSSTLPPADVPASAIAHPLLNRPFYLTYEDLNHIGTLGTVDASGYTQIGQSIVVYGANAANHFQPIITDHVNAGVGGNPVVAAAEFGSGYVVASSESISGALCANVMTTGVVDPEKLHLAPDADLKLAYNIVNWGSEHSTFHKDARHSGYSFQELGSALSELWTYRDTSAVAVQPAATPEYAPAILDDMVYYVDGSKVLHAFDLSPMRDRDGDGSPDDGIEDQAKGTPYDEVWNVDLSGYVAVSSPTAAYVPLKDPDSGSGAKKLFPIVLVTCQDGSVAAFHWVSGISPVALVGNSSYAFPSQAEMTKIAGGTNIAPAPPTYVDGQLYWGDGKGQLHGIDFTAATATAWTVATGTTQPSQASPTVGWVRDAARNVAQQVVYLADNTDGISVPGNIRPFVMKVVGDVLDQSMTRAGTLIPYFAREANGSKLKNVYVYFELPDGTQYSVNGDASCTVEVPTTQQGIINVTLPSDFFDTHTNLRGIALAADYDMDTEPVIGDSSLLLSRTTIEARRAESDYDVSIDAAPVLGQSDNLYFKTTNETLYAVQTTAAGRVVVKWRWPLAGTPFSNYRFVGSPVAAGDMVYATISSGSDGYVLAFQADPTVTINLGSSVQPGTTVTFMQTDPLTATGIEASVSSSTVWSTTDPTKPQYAPFTVDYDSGKLIFYNLRPGGNDSSQDLSSSTDFHVQFTNSAGTITDQIHAAFTPIQGDRWNNLVWYMPIAEAPTSAPTVMGNFLYQGCKSGTGGSIWTINLASTTQKYPGPVSEAVASNDLVSTRVVSAGDAVISAVAAANGMLAVATVEGLTVLYNPITLVADANRIVEIDASGQITWMCESTLDYAETTDNSGNPVYSEVLTPFNRPASARYSQTGGMVVADTGNNRVVQITKGGGILHDIKTFSDPYDPVTERSVLANGSPLSLNMPTDVSTWIDEDTNGLPVYHYLIADSGNFRVLEIQFRYNDVTKVWEDVVGWATQTYDQLGKEYRYVTARSIVCRDLTDPNNAALNKNMTACVISNAIPSMYAQDPTRGTEGYGSIVFVNGPLDATSPADPNDPTNEYLGMVPPYPDSGIYPNNFLKELNSGILGTAPNEFRLQDPTFFDRVFVSPYEYYDLILDFNGVHVKFVTMTSSGSSWQWRHYTDQNFKTDTGDTTRTFMPVYGQILANGNVLVVNKTKADSSGVTSAGEIVELTWSGANYTAVWTAPGTQTPLGPTGIKQPSSVDREIH